MTRIEDIQATALARFFSAGVLKEMATRGRSPMLARLIRESGLPVDASATRPVSEVFDAAFTLLKKRGNRHEYIYKAAITQKVLLGIHSLSTASMLTEFRVGPCKADVVILNGTGTVYEIKSERDSLSRLARQVEAYSSVFAKVNVIVGENHVRGVEESVPHHVGIQVLSNRYQITPLRGAEEDPGRTNPSAIFDSITLEEARRILLDSDVEVPDVPNTQRYRVWKDLFAKLEPEQAHRQMVDTLKSTRNLKPLQSLLQDVPESLHSASLTARLRQRDQRRLVEALRTPIQQALCWG